MYQVRRAQDAVLKTRPFSETLQKVLGGLIVRLKKDNFDSPLMTERPVNKVTILTFHRLIFTESATEAVWGVGCGEED